MATVVNDAVQGIIMLVTIVAVILAVLGANGGLANAVSELSQVSSPAEGVAAGSLTSLFGPDAMGLVTVIILTSLGTWGLPQMVQKFYAIRDDRAVRRGTIISTLFALVVAGGSYFLGGFGRLYADEVAMGAGGTRVFDSIIPTMLSSLPGHPDRPGGGAGPLRVDEHAVVAGADLEQHAHARLLATTA